MFAGPPGLAAIERFPAGVCRAAGPLSSPRRWDAAISESHRLFNCARCHRQVRICRRCDRGHRYCTDGCAQAARRDSVRRAGRTYQQSPAGRRRNGLRQARYRWQVWRQHARPSPFRVTHQGSPKVSPAAQLDLTTQAEGPATPTAATEEVHRHDPDAIARAEDCCHFCLAACGPFVRLDFLRRPWPRGRPRGVWR